MAIDREIRIPFAPSEIETIDAAMLRKIREFDLHTVTNEGFKKVPVIWASPERAFQVKSNPDIRDDQGALVFPIISIERTEIVKDPNKKGTVWANIPPVNDEKGGSIPVARRINQIKTKNFANADAKLKQGQINWPRCNPKVVYQTISMPLPVYVEVTYKITIRTEYQEQMNDLVTPFITRPGGINYLVLKHEQHSYEAFVQQNFSQKNNATDYTEEERKYETEITIKVLGYLIGDGKNQKKPFYSIRENAVEVKIPRERVILGDMLDHDGGQFYGLSGMSPTEVTFAPGVPYLFDCLSTNASSPGGGPASTSGDSITLNNFSQTLAKVYAIREIPTGATSGIQGPGEGEYEFLTSKRMYENTETVFINGLLQTPNVHYEIVNPYMIRLLGKMGADGVRKLKSSIELPPKGDTIIISYIID
jgi:hypothetical protein